MATAYPITPGVTYKSIERFPGYCFGDDGSVWSQRRPGRVPLRGVVFSGAWRKLGPALDAYGYHQVSLYGCGRLQNGKVHRLVLEAFVGPCPSGMECLHGPDPNKSNNTLGNLRWGTPQANARDRITQRTCLRGSSHKVAKITEQDVLRIRAMYAEGFLQREIGVAFGLSQTSIGDIVRRKTWTHVE